MVLKITTDRRRVWEGQGAWKGGQDAILIRVDDINGDGGLRENGGGTSGRKSKMTASGMEERMTSGRVIPYAVRIESN